MFSKFNKIPPKKLIQEIIDDDDSELNELKETQNEKNNEEKYLTLLKYEKLLGNVVKGIKETLKAIENRRAKFVYLAGDCELTDYNKILEEYCKTLKIDYYIVDKWHKLRDIVMKGPKSEEIEEKIKKTGKKMKMKPFCCSVAIINKN